MSVDSGTNGRDAPPSGFGCSLCDARLDGDDGLFVQCYPEDDRSLPDAAAVDGFLGVCADCAVEVDELVEAWTGHEEPPVDRGWPISDGYRRVAPDCSFCGRTLGEEPLLGVEYYRRGEGDGDLRSYANYSLCGRCVPVFEQFLTQLRDDGSA